MAVVMKRRKRFKIYFGGWSNCTCWLFGWWVGGSRGKKEKAGFKDDSVSGLRIWSICIPFI